MQPQLGLVGQLSNFWRCISVSRGRCTHRKSVDFRRGLVGESVRIMATPSKLMYSLRALDWSLADDLRTSEWPEAEVLEALCAF